MKSLKVPYIPELAGAGVDNIIRLLETGCAKSSIDQANWSDFSYKPITIFSLARDDSRFYLYYFVRGNCLRAVHYKDQDPVWTDSCVEFFVQVPGSEYYTNFEFNCIGTCYAANCKSRSDFTLLSAEQLSLISRTASLGSKPFQEMQGLFTWELLVEIPFSLLGLGVDNLPTMLKGNFYKCADKTELPHYVSWNAIDVERPDFHRPEFFGELILD